MNPAEQPAGRHPPPETIPALMRGRCELIEFHLSELAWLLAGQPSALPPGSIETILNLVTTIHELERNIRS